MSIKYIFCISTGRSGTKYLSKILSNLKESNVFYEHKPVMNGEMMQQYLLGNKAPLKKNMKEKIQDIIKYKGIYVDTSHLFIKGFGWEIPKYIKEEEIAVIILKRDPEKIANSTFRVHSSPFTYFGRKWVIVPRRNNLVKPPINYTVFWLNYYILKLFWILKGEHKSLKRTYPSFFKKLSIELLLWYVKETNAMSIEYQKKFKKITYVTAYIDDLNSRTGVKRLLDSIGLSNQFNYYAFNEMIGQKVNKKNHLK